MISIESIRHGEVLVLVINRSERGNRLTTEMCHALAGELETAQRNPGVGACVLTGAGDAFCLGGAHNEAGPRVADRLEYGRAYIRLVEAMARLGKPLITAVNGDAHAGGFTLVVASDLAVAADDATFGLPEAASGLFPLIAMAIVKDHLPRKVLFDLVYNARLLDCASAAELHLVNECVPRSEVLARSIDVARQAATNDPTLRSIGRDLYYSQRGMSPSESLEQARFALVAALSVDDHEIAQS